jgi:hypothetical protein
MKHIFCYLFLIIGCTTIANAQTNGLIAQYPLDGNAIDISLGNNNGILKGGVKAAMDRFGDPCGAVFFNGYDSYIEVPHTKTFNSISNKFTITGWFKLNGRMLNQQIKWVTLVCKGDIADETAYNPHFRFQLMQANTQATVSVNTDFTEYDIDYANHLFPYDKWTFCALSYDSKSVNYYLNDQLIWAFPYSGLLQTNSAPLHIGLDIPGATEYFDGLLDDIRIFNIPLDNSDLLKIYNEDNAEFAKIEPLICSNDLIKYCEPKKCGSTISFSTPSINGNCNSVVVNQLKGLPSNSFFNVGSTDILFRGVNQNGDQTFCGFVVNISDNESPVLRPLTDTIIYTSDSNLNGINFSYNFPKAFDNCGIKDVRISNGPKSGDLFKLGLNTVIFEATDIYGNVSNTTWTVNVKAKQISPIEIRDSSIVAKDDADTNMIDGLKDKVDIQDIVVCPSRILTILMFDDSVEDNDTVSIYFNSEVLFERVMIRNKKKGILAKTIILENSIDNIIASKAWNVGTISPNTLRIEIYEGDFERNLKLLKKLKPIYIKTLHSTPGKAGAIKLVNTSKK